jgi:hypothetical protein
MLGLGRSNIFPSSRQLLPKGCWVHVESTGWYRTVHSARRLIGIDTAPVVAANDRLPGWVQGATCTDCRPTRRMVVVVAGWRKLDLQAVTVARARHSIPSLRASGTLNYNTCIFNITAYGTPRGSRRRPVLRRWAKVAYDMRLCMMEETRAPALLTVPTTSATTKFRVSQVLKAPA